MEEGFLAAQTPLGMTMCFGVAIEGFRLKNPSLKKWSKKRKADPSPHAPKAGGWVRDDKIRSVGEVEGAPHKEVARPWRWNCAAGRLRMKVSGTAVVWAEYTG
jgi:hypothetical protein